jgi:hypothetical protein
MRVHNSTQSKVEPVLFRTPPSPRPLPLAAFVWRPFNKQEYSVSFAKEDSLFAAESNNGISATLPSASVLASLPVKLKPIYFLHARDSDHSIIAGAAILSLDSLCPPFDGSLNSNIFRSCFGIKFHAEDHTHIHVKSPFKFTLCFGLTHQLRYCLSQHVNWYVLVGGIPTLTLAWIFDHILKQLELICDSNTQIFPPKQFAAPAAHFQAFVSGVIATCLSDQARWIQAIVSDAKLLKIRFIVNNPSTLKNKALAEINYNYHAALRWSLIVIEDDVLIYHEPLVGMGLYTQLQLIPQEFQNILFVAFHSNPIGRHLNAYRTMHRLCLWYY